MGLMNLTGKAYFLKNTFFNSMNHPPEYPFDLAAKNLASQIFVEAVARYDLLPLMQRSYEMEEPGFMRTVKSLAMRSCVLAMAFNKAANDFDDQLEEHVQDKK